MVLQDISNRRIVAAVSTSRACSQIGTRVAHGMAPRGAPWRDVLTRADASSRGIHVPGESRPCHGVRPLTRTSTLRSRVGSGQRLKPCVCSPISGLATRVSPRDVRRWTGRIRIARTRSPRTSRGGGAGGARLGPPQATGPKRNSPRLRPRTWLTPGRLQLLDVPLIGAGPMTTICTGCHASHSPHGRPPTIAVGRGAESCGCTNPAGNRRGRGGARTVSVVCTATCRISPCPSAPSMSISSAASKRTVVSDGSVSLANAKSPKPVTEMSSGTRTPHHVRHAALASAKTSFAAAISVTSPWRRTSLTVSRASSADHRDPSSPLAPDVSRGSLQRARISHANCGLWWPHEDMLSSRADRRPRGRCARARDPDTHRSFLTIGNSLWVATRAASRLPRRHREVRGYPRVRCAKRRPPPAGRSRWRAGRPCGIRLGRHSHRLGSAC